MLIIWPWISWGAGGRIPDASGDAEDAIHNGAETFVVDTVEGRAKGEQGTQTYAYPIRRLVTLDRVSYGEAVMRTSLKKMREGRRLTSKKVSGDIVDRELVES